eukprot:Hpha_TRINITY_DN16099_c2_g3::TRINITY_DN16099_c2_g3_i4::g.119013::m.119013
MEANGEVAFDRWIVEAEKLLCSEGSIAQQQRHGDTIDAPLPLLRMEPTPTLLPATGLSTPGGCGGGDEEVDDDKPPALGDERRRRKKKRTQSRVPQWNHVWSFLSTMIRKRGGSDVLSSQSAEGHPKCDAALANALATEGSPEEDRGDDAKSTQGGMELSFRGVLLRSVVVEPEKRDVDICLSVSPTHSWAGEAGSYGTAEFKKRMTVLSKRLAERYHRRFGGRVHVQYVVEGTPGEHQERSSSRGSEAESTCPSENSGSPVMRRAKSPPLLL